MHRIKIHVKIHYAIVRNHTFSASLIFRYILFIYIQKKNTSSHQ